MRRTRKRVGVPATELLYISPWRKVKQCNKAGGQNMNELQKPRHGPPNLGQALSRWRGPKGRGSNLPPVRVGSCMLYHNRLHHHRESTG